MMKTNPTTVQLLTIAALLGTTPSMLRAQQKPRIAARAIPRGTKLSVEDIAGAAPHDSLIGWTTRRMIKEGETLRTPAIISPRVIASGDMVDVVFHEESITITAKGRATKDAGTGDRISIRLDEKRTIEGVVMGAGLVKVD